MAGTIRGRIETYHNTGTHVNNARSYFTSLYKFLKRLEVAGVTTEIARHGGGGGSAANVNYWDEPNPFLYNAWVVFRWNTNAGRTWPWYLYLQQPIVSTTGDLQAGPSAPCMLWNSATINGYSGVLVQAAMGLGGDQNPWNGTGDMGTNVKGTPVWRVPASGGSHLGIWPHSNGPDRAHGTRAKGQIVPVPGAIIVESETFTLSDGLNGNKVFEFDSDASVTPGNIPVTYTAGMTKYEVQAAIITAVNVTAPAAGDFFIRAWEGCGGNVLLMNLQGGVVGNVNITDTVADAGFLVGGMSGGVGQLQNCRPLTYTDSTLALRAHFVADDDNLVILTDFMWGYGANNYQGFFSGVYTPCPGVSTIATKPWVALQGTPIALSDGYINDYNEDSSYNVDTGVAVVDPLYGARGISISRLHEAQQAQPNRCFATPRYEEYPITFAGYEQNVLEPGLPGTSYAGIAGSVEFVRDIYGVAQNDTNADKTRAYFGPSGAGYRWSIPWDGVTTPGTGVSRDGVDF